MKLFDRKKIKIRKPKTFPHIKKHYKGLRKRRGPIHHKIMRQIILCIVIILLVIFIKHLNLPITSQASSWIKTTIEKEIDIRSTAIKLIRFGKKAPEFSEKAINAFTNFNKSQDHETDFLSPIPVANIVSNYGENTDPISNRKTFQRGIDILVDKKLYIQAVKGGRIIEIQESKNLGKYIKVEHSKNTFSIYGNCSEVLVVKGQKVKQGEKIALIYPDSTNKVSYFHFELWKEGKIVDPTQYIQFDKKAL